jgi:hypothetical protein
VVAAASAAAAVVAIAIAVAAIVVTKIRRFNETNFAGRSSFGASSFLFLDRPVYGQLLPLFILSGAKDPAGRVDPPNATNVQLDSSLRSE